MPRDIVERLSKDAELLAAHGITKDELEFLETVDLFGKVKSITDVLFILRNLRDSRPPEQ